MSGIVIALMELVNNTPGTATPIAEFAVMFAYNEPLKVIIASTLTIIISSACGYIGSLVFKKYPIEYAQDIRNNA